MLLVVEKKLSDPEWWSNYILDNHFENNLYLEFFNNNKKICTISGTNSNFLIMTNCDDKELDYSIQSCGLIDWYFDYPHTKSPSNISSIIATEGNLKNWLTDKVKNNIIAIDTNIIINRVFSSLLFMDKDDALSNLKLKIPRLSILELEKKANNQKKDFEKRKCFLAYGEILYMKNNGVESLPELNLEILTGFSKISGERKIDEWIRREIRAEQSNLQQSGTTVILMTSDLINSFSAIAEGIDTIYVHKILDHKNKIRIPTIKQIGRLLTTLAVAYENICVKINSEYFTVEGMWEGKTIHNWVHEQVYYYPRK